MKRTKIFSSICMLVLTLACLTFGVYSAVKTDFTASGTITFNAYNLDVDAKVTITGTEETYEPKYLTSNSERTEHIWTDVTYSPMTSLSLSKLTFDELGEHQNLINIHFEFVNYSNYQVEAIAETTTSGSAWDSNEDVSKLLYQPTMQTLMDSVENTSQNTSGFSIMFTPKGQQITGTAENMSIAVTLKPAEQEYAIETDGLTYYYSEDVYDRLNYNNLAYAIKSDTTVSVGFDETNGDTTLETYPIPTKIFGRTVDEVYEYAFNAEERVWDIHATLSYMFVPESVEILGENTFNMLANFHTIILSNGLISIGNAAFQECTVLKNITIPNSVTSIYSSFSMCDSLQSTVIGNGKYLLNEKSEPVMLVSAVDTTITNIDIPETVLSIHSDALNDCKNLTNVIIPNSVTIIGDSAFAGSGLVSIELPNSITRINNATFFACQSLTSVKIPNSVTSIGYTAFQYCTKLESIIIPSSVTSIDGHVFLVCSSLTSITIDGATATNWAYGDSSNVTYATGTKIDLTNPATNATYFVTTYAVKCFVKNV